MIYLPICALVALLGIKRKIGYGWSLFFCIFLSPLIGLIIILCSKRKKTEFFNGNQFHQRKPTSMKTASIIFFCFSGLNLLVFLIRLATGNPDGSAGFLHYTSLFGGTGAYFLDRAIQRKYDNQQRQKWLNGNQP